MDLLTDFFAHLHVSARVFFAGKLCGRSSDHPSETAGHLHILRSGTLELISRKRRPRRINKPSILFYPRPFRHRFQSSIDSGADLVCAQIDFGGGVLNPLLNALPDPLIVPLKSVKALEPTANMLFEEAFEDRPGRQAAVDRLTEYFFVLLLRAAIDSKLIDVGVFAGLGDPKIARAISAFHQRPQHSWTLREVASIAGMSRARFAHNFRKLVGMTPFEYLTEWRISLAQTSLKQGDPLKLVAPAVGYASSAVLTRAFVRHTGTTPSEWLKSLPNS